MNTENKNSKLMLVFWAVIPCGLAGRHKHFKRTYCLILYVNTSTFGGIY
jgi:hypothetical protein